MFALLVGRFVELILLSELVPGKYRLQSHFSLFEEFVIMFFFSMEFLILVMFFFGGIDMGCVALQENKNNGRT